MYLNSQGVDLFFENSFVSPSGPRLGSGKRFLSNASGFPLRGTDTIRIVNF